MKKGNQFIVRLLIVFAIAFGAQATASAQLGGLNVKNLKNKAKKAVDDKVYKEVNGAKGTAKFEVQKAVNEAEHDLKNKANATVKGSKEEQTEDNASSTSTDEGIPGYTVTTTTVTTTKMPASSSGSSSSNGSMTLYKGGSIVGNIKSDGTVMLGGSSKGKIDGNGNIYVGGSIEGQLRSNGDVLKKGSIVGNIDGSGNVRIKGSIVGQIRANGDVVKGGSIIGKVKDMSNLRKAAVVYFFGFYGI